MVGAAVAVVLVPVSFLPYSYDPAGPFKILPAQRSEAVAQIDGQVADIAVREGDWVNAGQVLAHLSSSDQQRNVDLARQNLKDAETRLAQLGQEQSGRSKVEPPSSDMQRGFAQSEVERLRDQLDSDEAGLERTTVRAPAAGFVTTPNAQLLTGVWLEPVTNSSRSMTRTLLRRRSTFRKVTSGSSNRERKSGCGRGRKTVKSLSGALPK